MAYPGTPRTDRDGTPLRVGDRVRCERPAGRPVGSWTTFQGRAGRVERFNGLEIGVSIDGYRPGLGPHDVSWFVPAEVVRVL